MSTKTRTTPGRWRRITALLTLTPMLLLNASQATILCVGQDGHVAVELVLQDRCTCQEQTPGPQSVLVDVAARIVDVQSNSCTDFAMPVGSCGVRVAPVTDKAIVANLAPLPPLLSSSAFDTLGSPSRDVAALSCCRAPLDGIILRV